MLNRLFGSRRISPEVRPAVLDYLKKEVALNALQDDEAGRYNQVLTRHGAGNAPRSEAAKEVADAAARMAVTNRSLVAQHLQLGSVPDEAGPCYVAWHSTYLILADWAEAAAAACRGLADGAMPILGRVHLLLQEEERQRRRAVKAEGALMKRIRLTAEEMRQVIATAEHRAD